jgi:hypothetical protein
MAQKRRREIRAVELSSAQSVPRTHPLDRKR